MKSTQLIGLAAEHNLLESSGNDPTVADLINALEERHQCIHSQWQEIMERLPAEKPDVMMDQLLLMDHEISRYQRYFVILKETLRHREPGLLNVS